MRPATVALVVMMTGWAGSIRTSGECLGVRPLDAKRAASLVFEGLVAKVERLTPYESAATLKVHRVWKGDVRNEITVYYRAMSIDGPVLNKGERRIIFAVPQTPAMRPYGSSPDTPLRQAWVPPCSGSWPADESVVRQLGRSHEPKDPAKEVKRVLH